MINSAKFWDKIAPKYAKAAIKDVESYQYTLDRTRSYLGAQDKVLEIGAGTGSTALELASSAGHVTITDVSPEMIRIGQERAQEQGITNVDFHVTDAGVSNLTGPYDAVLAHNVLHLIEDLPAALDRVHDLLAPGGVFISKTFCKPTRRGPWFYYAMKLLLPVMQLVGKAPFVSMMTIQELEAMITAHGFKIIESGNFPAKELRRYIVARR
ncbi:class I SAM-dependent methyltransferase [Aliiroseovarius sp. S1339]|uniref:class I SAM-dependent methyltransferase n=1 Tax=Aliiroseovarius sp. S1339 TaxID=2936990 RepID=UPI0020BEB077|nr:class I SAM-dependent methyltransferase [Aliiroseovarius sp. S1339]MCK8464783.1 class I SAM-dependent methyltransferase [Aliiroseovarius sp. S1339]